MANSKGSLPAQAFRLVQKVATGQHVLSRAVPLLLLLLDGLLCVVIIKKVPCESLWTSVWARLLTTYSQTLK